MTRDDQTPGTTIAVDRGRHGAGAARRTRCNQETRLSQGKTAQNFIKSQVIDAADQDVSTLVKALEQIPDQNARVQALSNVKDGVLTYLQQKAINPNSGQMSGAKLATAIRAVELRASSARGRVRRWWEAQPKVARWLACVMAVVILGLALYCVWLGYDIWPVVGIFVFYVALLLIAPAVNAFTGVVRSILAHAGLLLRARALTSRADRAINLVNTGALWIAGIAVGLCVAYIAFQWVGDRVKSLPIPAAIIVGALIIAVAIGQSRRG